MDQLQVTLGAVFGQNCCDPAPYIPQLLEKLCRDGCCCGWAVVALAEIAARGDNQLQEHSEELIEWAVPLIEHFPRGYPHSLDFVNSCGVFRLLGQLGDMTLENILKADFDTAVAECKGPWDNNLVETLRNEAASALSLIRSRAEDQRRAEEHDFLQAEHVDADHGSDLHDGAGSVGNLEDATEAVEDRSAVEGKLEQVAAEFARVLGE